MLFVAFNHVSRTTLAMLSCRPLADIHYNNSIVTLDIVCDAFLNLFLVCLKLNKASFIAQRGVPEPLEPSVGYATECSSSLFLPTFTNR